MEDSRGVIRGPCSLCGCAQYTPAGDETVEGSRWKCSACGHPPAKHRKLGAKKTCRYPGCYQPLDFDPNTGKEEPCCREHAGYDGPDSTVLVHDLEDGDLDDFSSCGGGVVDGTAAVVPTPYQPLWNHQYTTGEFFSYTKCVAILIIF